ncbi:hypothetical protein GIB67_001892 [Kingdonia uniflora]|uniref:Cyclin N-terminal domain-containing protein n=1 Tax=Kingdonia uniflora TaxID=39325 RepID=A0A7J7LQF5_9MAGN|nr:hypothetical protein GIB67_001892 [Kingdonia uniflora]
MSKLKSSGWNPNQNASHLLAQAGVNLVNIFVNHAGTDKNKIAHDECAPTIRSVMANIHSAIHEAATNFKGYMKNIHAEMDTQHKLEVPFMYMRPPRIRSCVWELLWYEEVKINCYGCSPSNPGMAGSGVVFMVYTGERGKAWIKQLLDIACLFLAPKMEEIEVPVEEYKFIFEVKNLQIMELQVLGTLKWRMKAATPFTFMDYFFRKNNDDLPPPSTHISRLVKLILRRTRGIEYLEFKPSEAAAAVLISVIMEINLDKYEPYFIKMHKRSTKDHVSHEDESKTSKDSVESSENDVQVLVGCCINDQH